MDKVDFSKPTEISAFGYKFADFVRIFKKNYSIDANTYDFIGFIKDVDPTSFEVFIKNEGSKENANEILNSQFAPLIKNIQVGGKSKQKGGFNWTGYFQIFVFFLLEISAVNAGPAADRLKEFKDSGVIVLPLIQPGAVEGYRKPGWIYGLKQLTPEDIKEHSDDIARFEYLNRVVLQAEEEERVANRVTELSATSENSLAHSEELDSQTSLLIAQQGMFNSETIRDTIGRFDTQVKKNEKLMHTMNFFSLFVGTFLGMGLVAAIYYYDKYFNQTPDPDTRTVDITYFYDFCPEIIDEYVASKVVLKKVNNVNGIKKYTYWTNPETSNLLNTLIRNTGEIRQLQYTGRGYPSLSSLSASSFNDENPDDSISTVSYSSVPSSRRQNTSIGSSSGYPSSGTEMGSSSGYPSSRTQLDSMGSYSSSRSTMLDPRLYPLNRQPIRQPLFERGGKTVKKRRSKKSKKRIRKSNKKSKKRN
jgi:hypothetical protein